MVSVRWARAVGSRHQRAGSISRKASPSFWGVPDTVDSGYRTDQGAVASGYLVALITVELYILPEGVLNELLAAVPHWRSGIERQVPLPIKG